MSTHPLTEVFAEMRRARELHGERYMGNLAPVEFDSTEQAHMVARLREALENARFICDGPRPTHLGMLIEKVCELADDVVDGEEYRAELVQVAAMVLAWLGVDPGDASHAHAPAPSRTVLMFEGEEHELTCPQTPEPT